MEAANDFNTTPYVLVTAEHTKRNVKHDATTVWVENIRMNTFKVCVRELQNFDGQHKDIKVTQGFQEAYHSTPTVILSAAHNSAASFSMSPEFDSIATWVEKINPVNCSVCIKEINNINGYDPVIVSMLIIGAPGHKCDGATALGVGNQSRILDSQITASSKMNAYAPASYGRLNGKRGKGWCARTANGSHDWLQVNLGKTYQVCSVAVQGDLRWVTDFKLRYSTDGITWKPYMDANGAQVEFHRAGVISSSTITTYKFPVALSARYLRFTPTKQNNWNCLRVEVYGY